MKYSGFFKCYSSGIRRCLFFTVFLTISDILISCQDPKSLNFDLHKTHVDSLLAFSKEYRYINARKALDSARLALDIARTNNFVEEKIKAFNETGLALHELGKFQDALSYQDSAVFLSSEIDPPLLNAISLSNKGTTLINLGRHVEAVENFLKALSILENYDEDSRYLADIYNNLGYLHRSQRQYDLALKFYKKASAIDSANHNDDLAVVLNNIGEIYRFSGDLDSANFFYTTAKTLNEKTGNLRELAFNLNNLGIIYSDKGDFEVSLDFFKRSLDIKQQVGHKRSLISAYTNIAIVHQLTKDYSEAQYYYEKALAVADSLNYKEGLVDAYFNIFTLYEETGDYKNAYIFSRRHDHIKDSLINDKTQSRIQRLEAIFEAEKKDNQIQLLQKGNLLKEANLKNQSIILSSLALGVLMLGIFITVLYKGNKSLARKNDKINTLINELSHRTKNNLQVLSSFLRLQLQDASEEAKKILLESQNRVFSLALLHQKLHWETHDQATLNIKTYLVELVDNITSSYGLKDSFDLNLEKIDIEQLHLDTAVPVGLITNELVTNAFKHAFQTTKPPALSLSFESNDQRYFLKISDNGIGIKKQENLVEQSSLGLKIVHALVDQLGGEIQCSSSSDGTEWIIFFPMV